MGSARTAAAATQTDWQSARSGVTEVVNALYVADNGIKWRALPHDFPAWETVYGYFRRWTHSGVWEAVNQALSQQVRVEAGRHEQPSLGLIDSQSVKMAQKRDLNTGLMATKVKGRKRHLMVDVLGLVMSCFVSAANVADVKAAPAVLVPALENNPDLRKILADQSYRGAIAVWLADGIRL
jgi:putative transposase